MYVCACVRACVYVCVFVCALVSLSVCVCVKLTPNFQLTDAELVPIGDTVVRLNRRLFLQSHHRPVQGVAFSSLYSRESINHPTLGLCTADR